ncbi:DEDD exonuclease domain-containing protein [Raineyella sp. LH-20]|uniref:DEDD exonuclease domain-containing protein n=1 Tax=Raineyella sp. LH-20 TaxID=3081204 RepID=UPI002952B483|nr:DEDD exonuclease domain-containing protein [Raineyella sp. LH-20]WOP17616.1 DEDD exonuclease domain-containing protein [Raineyella sp. LH-20]
MITQLPLDGPPRITDDLQPSFGDLGEPLAAVDFCVVDLETTGTGRDAAITEIGASHVRAGEVVGEFQTLVDPECPVPAEISALTGITPRLLRGAPTLPMVLPAFLEFSRGCVMVAHNARFDMGFLRRGCDALGYPWQPRQVLDTLALARQIIPRTEVRNYALGTLAAHVRADTTPTHRALEDVRATVDLLHYLIARVGNRGVSTLEDLVAMMRPVSPARRQRAPWAKDLPHAPGVYWFYRGDRRTPRTTDPATDPAAPALVPATPPDRSLGPAACERPDDGPREILYVGTSVDIRRRVQGYFTASERRARMEDMIRQAEGVDCVECRTPLEARVREVRLITAHQPRYNRRSKRAAHPVWIVLTDEAYPRLSVVRDPGDKVRFGPFPGREAAQPVVEALQEAFPVRRCTTRLSVRRPTAACALAEMGRCPAPCDHRISREDYALVVGDVVTAMAGDVAAVVRAHADRIGPLSDQQRYEEADEVRARLQDYLDTSRRHHRIASLVDCPQLVAARRTTDTFAPAGAAGRPGWEIHVIRHGRLAGAARTRPGESAVRVAEEAVLLAESVPAARRGDATIPEETGLIASWLEEPGVRLIDIQGDWMWPLRATVTPDALPQVLAGLRGDTVPVPADPRDDGPPPIRTGVVGDALEDEGSTPVPAAAVGRALG